MIYINNASFQPRNPMSFLDKNPPHQIQSQMLELYLHKCTNTIGKVEPACHNVGLGKLHIIPNNPQITNQWITREIPIPTPHLIITNHLATPATLASLVINSSSSTTKDLQNIRHQHHQINTAKMPSGKATATINGRTIAETDTWEFVEGNVYVSARISKTWWNC